MANPYRLQEREDAWVLHLGKRVTTVRVGTGFNIELLDGLDRVEISIGGPFQLTQGCVVREFDPEQWTKLGPALTVIHKIVEQAVAFKDGRLRLEFADGSRVTSGPHPQFESWQIQGWDADAPMLIVCGIGGQLFVWDGGE